MISKTIPRKKVDRCICGNEKMKLARFCRNCTIVIIKKRAFLKDKMRAKRGLTWRSKHVEVADIEKLVGST